MRTPARSAAHRPAVWMRRGFLFLLILLAPLLARAQQGGFHIVNFDDEITVDRNGSAHVVETLTLRVTGSIHGVRRFIPVRYTDNEHAAMRTLEISNLQALGENGEKLKVEQSRVGDNLVAKIYIPDAQDADKTIHILYDVEDAVRRVGAHSEFYWNVTGNGWGVAIDEASAHVILPEGAGDKLRAQGAFGAYGDKSPATAVIHGSEATISAPRPLAPHEGLTLDIYLPQGVITPPSAAHLLLRFLRSNLIMFMPLVALGVMFAMWWFKGREPDPGISEAPQYEPPKGLTPVECGTLIDDSLDARDVTATLIDLAVRGYLKIVAVNEGPYGGKSYLFRKGRPRADWEQLKPFERTMLEGIFATVPGDSDTAMPLEATKQSFYLYMPAFRQQVRDSLIEQGMYRIDPDSANGYALAGGLISAGPFVAAAALFHINYLRTPLLLLAATALTIAIVFFFRRILPAKSLEGMRALVHIRGFKEFMERVDGDRLRKLPPEHFEKCLPYAMAFGVEKNWAKAFEGLLQGPPDWYDGGVYVGGFSVWILCSALSSMGDDAYASFTSRPSSGGLGDGFGGDSSSGGFSDFGGGGGDFSGGGFGGGGGDSF